MDTVILEEKPAAGITLVNGKEFMQNAKGGLDPIGRVKPESKLEDQTVRTCIAFALDLSGQISRFKGHTAADLARSMRSSPRNTTPRSAVRRETAPIRPMTA